jgi:uncharacterized repeat protein (TIGR01451 family)
MREAFGRAITVGWRTRGLCARACVFALLAFALFGANDAGAQAITRFVRDTGNINFTTTGGSLRSAPNVTAPCTINSTSTQALNGIPAGRTVRTAYLYWGASGSAPDTSVTLNGNTVTASRTFQTTFDNGTQYDFYGGFADVTSLVAGNGSFTFGGLNISTGTPWCTPQAVVGGWSLIVIYEGVGERLRAINLYDGLDYFYGSSVTQTPDGFRVPATNIDGRIAVFTLEGDPQNSLASGAFSEALRFNGTTLDDGLVPANSNPTVQQFDGTINTAGGPNNVQSYGIDVDQYDVSTLLAPGQTSATTVYSAGQDLVLLMAQIVSATSDPAVDLSVTKSHSGTFISGQTGQYTITVSNAAGMEREDNTVTVTDTLPAGLTFNSATGTGWTCGAVAQVVTCTHAPPLNAGASLPPITLTVNVLEAAAASVTNSVTVSSASYDLSAANNTATDVTATLDPDVSTSTKTVVDLNGGEAAPGDTLRYTVTLNESAGAEAINVSVTDNIPANTTFASFFSLPAGATSSFTPAPAGTFNRGVFTVSGITVPASGSAAVVFDVTVNAGTGPGEFIDNTADVTNPNGAENDPAAPQIEVTPSLVPASGIKFLYLRRNAGGTESMSRVRPTAADTTDTVNGGANDTWTIAPALQGPLTIPTGNIPVRLWLTRQTGSGNRVVTVTLSASGIGTIATLGQNINPSTSATPSLHSFNLVNGTLRNLPAGATLTLTVANPAGETAITIHPNGNGGSTAGVPNNSRVELNTTTVINVDSVTTWSAAFNGGVAQGTFYPGATVFVRAQVSDPFGSFDISSATIELVNPAGTTVVPATAMTAQGAPATCGSQTAATCIFQYSYALGASPAVGTWTARIVANEGQEGTVTDLGIGTFVVEIPQPSLTILKTSTVLSDPVNNTTNPKRIPQAVVRYDITTTNSGPGVVDANTLVITDPIPADAAMYVLAAGNPVVFVNGAPVSGLTFNYAANVSYSSTGVAGPFNYTPSPDADGFDPLVRAVRIAPGGTMNAAGGGNPSFTLQFRVRIN